MGLEMLRNKYYICVLLAVVVLLAIYELKSYSYESAITVKIGELESQLSTCSMQIQKCTFETNSVNEQNNECQRNVVSIRNEKSKLSDDIASVKHILEEKTSKLNDTQKETLMCQTELQSLKGLELSKTATLELLRIEKDKLVNQLSEKKEMISELEKQINKLKDALETKVPPVLPTMLKSSTQVLKSANAQADQAVMGRPDDIENAAFEVMDVANDNALDERRVH